MEIKFYKTDRLSLDKKISILNEAIRNKRYWQLDRLTNKSWSREMVKTSLGRALKKFDEKFTFKAIGRYNPYQDKRTGEILLKQTKKVKSSYIDYFLWIYMDYDKFEQLVKKFKLKEVKYD